jgi:structural maintenance of chromosome 2
MDIVFFRQLHTSLGEKSTQVETLTASYSTVKDQHTANQKTLSTAEELLQTLLTGLSSNNSNAASGGGYMGQLASAKQRVAQGEAEEEQARVKLSMSEKEMKALKGKWSEVEREAKEGERKVKEVKKAVGSLRERLGKCGWDEEMDKKQEEGMRTARSEIRELNDVSALCTL